MLKKLSSKEGFQRAMGSIVAIIAGLLIGFVIITISNPSKALGGIGAMLFGALSDMKKVGQVFYFATPLIMTGLSVGFANKTGLFNIGGPGQFILGAFTAIWFTINFQFPGSWLVGIILAMIVGGLWGVVPGALKAYCNVNEVITCIMMNYTGMYLVNFLIKNTSIYDKLRNQTAAVPKTGVMPKLGLDKLFSTGHSSSSVNMGILIAIAFGILVYIILSKTKFGFELKACGYNKDAAKYAGMNENKSIVYSMAIAGALCGVGGALHYLAGAGKCIEVIDVLAVEGFDGIAVSLLGLNNPIGIIFAGIFVAYLKVGGSTMQLHGFVPEIIEIITAVIIYFSAFALLIRTVIAKFAKSDEGNANKDDEVELEAKSAMAKDEQKALEEEPNELSTEGGEE